MTSAWSRLNAAGKAAWLLETIRRTPMVTGSRFDATRAHLYGVIARDIEQQGVWPRLARRLARQLLCKCNTAALEGPTVWRAIGRIVRDEIAYLQERVGLVDRQVVVALPKMS